MNNRSLSRGDAGVIGAAVLLFISSFLEARSAGPEDWTGWSADWFPILPSVFLAGIIGGGLIVGSRFLPQPDREFLGLKLNQWGIALSVTSAWAGFWSLVGGFDGIDAGVGLILGFIAALALAFFAGATPMIPALQAPLTSSSPAQPGAPGAPYGGVQQQQGYGYPGGQQQPGGYGQPGGVQTPPPAGADPNFQPFWFAVPAARPLYGEDGSPTPVAELAPGTWYLAVEQRGQTLVAQTQDGRRGVLQDTSGIQRG
ncbi:hypothetical protein FH609_002305 [Streptomyces sp. 3MP-14]|uniref:Uncharacterized protein n=1 Tax=Streptomyces mimosae TaxID=2586635 RepID=A0A5N6ARS1_9ACTN|nr:MULTISPECIES: DUF5336 domain-containing protein [Streptomyces]KAB8170812.1 hypothetical protein FH607_000165 [Streptomyces mimosae]KAB8179835.1 hypothetical protein FH609_002305 [Streptomyces sp. 3MP-14]